MPNEKEHPRSDDFVIVPKRTLSAVRDHLDAALGELDKVDKLPTLTDVLAELADLTKDVWKTAKGAARPKLQYKVGRWEHSYADVVYAEMPDKPFNTDQAWEKIRPVIRTEGDPHRSSMVRSLRSDNRFEEIEVGKSGLWFRKVAEPDREQDIDE